MLPRNFLAAGPGLGFTRSSIEPVKVLVAFDLENGSRFRP